MDISLVLSLILSSELDQINMGPPLRYPLSNKTTFIEIGPHGKKLSLNIHTIQARLLDDVSLPTKRTKYDPSSAIHKMYVWHRLQKMISCKNLVV